MNESLDENGWPLNDELMSFTEMTKQLKDAFNQAVKIKKGFVPIKWKGVRDTECSSHVNLPIQERFTKEYRTRRREQGDNILDILIGVALNMGMEQGIRLEKKNSKLRV